MAISYWQYKKNYDELNNRIENIDKDLETIMGDQENNSTRGSQTEINLSRLKEQVDSIKTVVSSSDTYFRSDNIVQESKVFEGALSFSDDFSRNYDPRKGAFNAELNQYKNEIKALRVRTNIDKTLLKDSEFKFESKK